MAIKLKNVLINLHIEDDIKRISQVVYILVEKHGYEPSQIKPSLLISDMVYIEIAEEFGHYEIREALCAPIALSNPQEFDDHMEQMFNHLIPNREPEYLKYMDIAQQLTQARTEIETINDQNQDATTRLTNEPLAEEKISNIIEKGSIPEYKIETTRLYRIDTFSLEICQARFKDIIITSKSKQGVLHSILDNLNHFNPNCFNHKDLANELNILQDTFRFSKADVDAAYKNKDSKK